MNNALQSSFVGINPIISKSNFDRNAIQRYDKIPKEKLYLMLMRYGKELEESVPILEERVNFTILFQRIDHDEIEMLLNRLLDCATWEMGLDTFERLIGYYHKLNPLGAINFQCELNKIKRLQLT
jgi:hypothetical protein